MKIIGTCFCVLLFCVLAYVTVDQEGFRNALLLFGICAGTGLFIKGGVTLGERLISRLLTPGEPLVLVHPQDVSATLKRENLLVSAFVFLVICGLLLVGAFLIQFPTWRSKPKHNYLQPILAAQEPKLSPRSGGSYHPA